MDLDTHSTYQLSELVLKLRDDLSIAARRESGTTTWLLEDERTSRFYRVGQREYTFLSLLDGRRTFGAALGRSAALLKERALSEEEAAALCRWLVESGLATTTHSRTAARLLQSAVGNDRNRMLGRWLSPLSQQIPLCRPDPAFQWLATLFGWVFSAPIGLVWLGAVIAGSLAIAQDWERFRGMSSQIVARDNWLWLGVIWVVLKFLHEAGHGIACRRFGGPVREAGLSLVLFVPLPYVDVTSAWRFGSKRRRMLVSAAGMGVELFVGAVAALVWSRMGSGLVSQYAQAVVLSATAMTILFNANPLMRLDGYYLLTDLFSLPNLAAHGREAWRQLARRWCLGLPGSVPTWPEGRTGIVLAYGLAALVWRVTVCIGLVLAADALLLGAGLLLAAPAALIWGVWPIVRILKFVTRGDGMEHPSRTRFAGFVMLTALVAVAAFQSLTWGPRVDAPLVVAYYPSVEVRAAEPGFVAELAVTDSAAVRAGDVLLRLNHPELDVEISELERQIEQSEVRAAQLLQAVMPAAWEAEQERLLALQRRREQLETRRSALTILAPCDGVVLNADVGTLTGRFVQAGEPLLTLGGRSDKQLLAVIDPAAREQFVHHIAQSLDVHLAGRGSLSARVEDVASRAERSLPHPALGAHCQGELAVRPVQTAADHDSADTYEFADPRLLVRLHLSAADAARLQAGETGSVRLPAERRPLAVLLRESVANWWARRETALRDQWTR